MIQLDNDLTTNLGPSLAFCVDSPRLLQIRKFLTKGVKVSRKKIPTSWTLKEVVLILFFSGDLFVPYFNFLTVSKVLLLLLSL